MLGGVQFETEGLGPVPYLNILGGTSQKNTLYNPRQRFVDSLQTRLRKPNLVASLGLLVLAYSDRIPNHHEINMYCGGIVVLWYCDGIAVLW